MSWSLYSHLKGMLIIVLSYLLSMRVPSVWPVPSTRADRPRWCGGDALRHLSGTRPPASLSARKAPQVVQVGAASHRLLKP